MSLETRCKTCKNPYIFQINTAIASGQSVNSVAANFHIAEASLRRHVNNCKEESKPETTNELPDSSLRTDEPVTKRRKSILLKPSPIIEAAPLAVVIEPEIVPNEDVCLNDEQSSKQPVFELVNPLDTINWTIDEHLTYIRQGIYAELRFANTQGKMQAFDRLHKNLELTMKREQPSNPEQQATQKAVFEAAVKRIMEIEQIDRPPAVERVIKLKPEAAKYLN